MRKVTALAAALKKSALLLALLAVFAPVCPAQTPASPASGTAQAVAPKPDKWAKAIAAFAAQDKENPPAPGGVLFLGSSSIRLWKTLAEDFPGAPVLNRGFGGSHIADSVRHFDTLVLPSKPRLIVFFAGGNDLAAGKPPEEVAADFRALVGKIHAALPGTRVIFISQAIVPRRWENRAVTALLNTYVTAFCSSDERLRFVDTNAVMLAPDGTARPEYYGKDRLHMSPAGYAVWAKLLRPLVK